MVSKPKVKWADDSVVQADTDLDTFIPPHQGWNYVTIENYLDWGDSYESGKWLLFVPDKQFVDAFRHLARLAGELKLGHSFKAMGRTEKDHPFCLYCPSYRDVPFIRKVAECLLKEGFIDSFGYLDRDGIRNIYFKPDEATSYKSRGVGESLTIFRFNNRNELYIKQFDEDFKPSWKFVDSKLGDDAFSSYEIYLDLKKDSGGDIKKYLASEMEEKPIETTNPVSKSIVPNEKIAENTFDRLLTDVAFASRFVYAGYEDLESIARARRLELMVAGNISETEAEDLIMGAQKKLGWGFPDLSTKYAVIRRITTGSSKLDEMLGGGIETQSITEFHGKKDTGKTQLAFQISVNTLLPEGKGGLNSQVIFIDADGTFNIQRISRLAKEQGLEPNEALEKIHVIRATNFNELTDSFGKAKKLLETDKIRLIVMDSFIPPFEATYPGTSQLAIRYSQIFRFLNELQKIADTKNIAVVITNQETPKGPKGGKLLGNQSVFRIRLTKKRGKNPTNIANLVDSPNLPNGKEEFIISDNGIVDVGMK